jgi:hypothetical protein
MLDLVAGHNINVKKNPQRQEESSASRRILSVKTNPFNGLQELPRLIELAHSRNVQVQG